MIWSGLLIYWSYDIYRIGLGQITLFHFFPDGIYSALKLDHRLAFGMALHFTFMWLFALNGLLYVLYTIVSGEWRELVPNVRSFREAIQVTLYDFGLAKTLPPQGKYNAAQKIAYSAIIAMGCASILTGLAIYRPVQLSWLTSLLGGYQMARFEHFWLTMGYLGFFVIHIAQVIRAGWRNFQSIVTGVDYQEVAGE
jgi:thiosulfate reductase cytochrome b subunit